MRGKKKRSLASYYRKTQPCWNCTRCNDAACIWIREGKPIDGWTAEKTYIEGNGSYSNSYKIIYCPNYNHDRKIGF